MDNLQKVRSSTLKDGDVFKRYPGCSLTRKVQGNDVVRADNGLPLYCPETFTRDYCNNCEEDVYLITEE